LLVVAARGSAADPGRPHQATVPLASRVESVRLDEPRRLSAAADTSLTCFEGLLTGVINPGCFNPPTDGSCTSASNQFFVQDIVPSFPSPLRVKAFAFISNDGATVFPSAGVVTVPFSDNRFPTPAELAALQVHNVPTPHDTAIVVVDMRPYNIQVSSDTDVYVCLQFPAGGRITGVGTGPGILVDEVAPDPNCDFLTADSGATFFRPAPASPTDFGFEVIFEPLVAIEPVSWSSIKALYSGAPAKPILYRTP
jgi:hypothetical protein